MPENEVAAVVGARGIVWIALEEFGFGEVEG